MDALMERLRAGRSTGWGIFHPGSGPMIVGGLMLMISAFLPWVHVTLTQSLIGEAFALRGTDGPGVATLALGFLALAGGLIPRRRLAIAHAAVAGVPVALIVVLQIWNIIAASAQTAWGSFLPGMGVVLAGGAAVILIRATVMMWRRWVPEQGAAARPVRA